MAELTVAANEAGEVGDNTEATSEAPPVEDVEKEESLEDLVSLLFKQLRSTPEDKWVQSSSTMDSSVMEAFANAGVGVAGDEKSFENKPLEGEKSPPADSNGTE